MEKQGAVYQVNNAFKGAGGVRFPSDSLSAKEKAAMNGVCITYDMSTFDKPTTWEIFSTWPKDIQRNYLKKCYCTHEGNLRQIADMFGVCKENVRRLMKDYELPIRKRGYPHNTDPGKWEAFLKSGVTTTISDAIPKETADKLRDMVKEEPKPEAQAAPKPEAPKPEPKVELKFEPKPELKPAEGNRVLAIAALLEQLKGSGAKISLEVVL